jgi:hypothetical protein
MTRPHRRPFSPGIWQQRSPETRRRPAALRPGIPHPLTTNEASK